MKIHKQVIVMRSDLNMGRGKMIAQGSHASCAFLITRLLQLTAGDPVGVPSGEMTWIAGGQTKICVRVDSEAELLEIAAKAEAAGLHCHVVADAGHTEFHGVPTKTCLAIGPNEAIAVDTITGHLKLL